MFLLLLKHNLFTYVFTFGVPLFYCFMVEKLTLQNNQGMRDIGGL